MNTRYNKCCNISCFSEQNRERLLALARDRTYAKGDHLFWEGDIADKLFLIKSGSVKLTKSTSEGKELIFYMYQTDDLISQVHPFHSIKHNLTAEVVEEGKIGIIEKEDIETIICLYHDFSIEFVKWMVIHHRLTQIKFRDLMMYGKLGALSSTLIRLSNTYGQEQEDGSILIHHKITHTDLCNMIGSTRESVNRMVSDLRKRQVLEYRNGLICIKQLGDLQELCNCEKCPKEICRM